MVIYKVIAVKIDCVTTQDVVGVSRHPRFKPRASKILQLGQGRQKHLSSGYSHKVQKHIDSSRLACEAHPCGGVWGHAPPRKSLEFRTSEIASAGTIQQTLVQQLPGPPDLFRHLFRVAVYQDIPRVLNKVLVILGCPELSTQSRLLWAKLDMSGSLW